MTPAHPRREPTPMQTGRPAGANSVRSLPYPIRQLQPLPHEFSRPMPQKPDEPGSRAWQHARLAIAWALFVTYGSLVPLEYKPLSNPWQHFLHTPWLHLGVGSRADWVANILLYVVLAYFATGAVWASRLGIALRVVLLGLVFSACLGLAVGIEFLQQFFPPRTVSLNDLLAEAIGTGLGALSWFISGKRIAVMWERYGAWNPPPLLIMPGLLSPTRKGV